MSGERVDLVSTFCERWGANLPMIHNTPEWLSYTMRIGAGCDVSAFDGTVQALRLLFHGRWGNYVLELINMFHIAEMTGVKKLYIFPTEIFSYHDGLVLDGIEIATATSEGLADEYSLTGNYFDPRPFGALTQNLDAKRRGELAAKYVRPLLTKMSPCDLITADDLVIHIRSGDIFEGVEGEGGANFGGSLYIQPPLSFYMAVVDRAFKDKKGNIFIISENALNPVILPLVRTLSSRGYGVTLRLNQSLLVDLSWLFSARSAVFANGTIGLAIAILSTAIQDAYFFRHDGTGTGEKMEIYVGDQIRKHFIHDADGSYIIEGQWRNTAEQRREMIHFPLEGLVWDDDERSSGAGPLSPLEEEHYVVSGSERAIDIHDSWIGEDGRKYADEIWSFLNHSSRFLTFRRNPAYRVVLEHIDEALGRQYLDTITDPAILQICRESERADRVGSPTTFPFLDTHLAPSTFRYAKSAQDLSRFFPQFATFASIIEIGVGYGAQARFISEYSRKSEGALKEYSLVDLLPVLDLARLYLENFDIKPTCHFMTKPEIPLERSWDLVISNFCFSMLTKSLQEQYLDRVLRRAKSGFLTMNTGLPNKPNWKNGFYAEELLRLLPNASLQKEEPLTGDSNYIIVFGEHGAGHGLSLADFA